MSERRRQEKARVIPTGWDDENAPATDDTALDPPRPTARRPAPDATHPDPRASHPDPRASHPDPRATHPDPRATHPSPVERNGRFNGQKKPFRSTHVGPGSASGSGGTPGQSERPGSPAGPEGRWPRSRSPRRRTLAIVGTLALIIGAVLVLPSFVFVDSPERAAREYLDALVEGDVEVLTAHSESLRGATGATLAGPIYQAAQDRVTSYRINAVEASDTAATVQVTLDAGPEQKQTELSLTAHSAGPFAPVDWRVDPVPLTSALVTYPLGTLEILVNGFALPIADLTPQIDDMGQPTLSIALLPGTYEIAMPDAGEYLDPIAATVTAPAQLTIGGPRLGETGYGLSELGHQYVIDEIVRELEECLSTHADPLGGCEVQYPVEELPLDEDTEVLENDGDTDALEPDEVPEIPRGLADDLLPPGAEVEARVATVPELVVFPSPYGTFEVYGFDGELEVITEPGLSGEAPEVTKVSFGVIASVVPHTPGEPPQVMLADPSTGLVYDMCIEAETGRAYAAVREPGTDESC